MELKIIGGVIGFSIVIFIIALLLPTNVEQNVQGLPWQIQQQNGTIQVFNLTLGKSTLSEAENLLQGDAEISLFHSQDGSYSVEAYFDKVEMGGLTAKMILVMNIPAAELREMYLRGVRISQVGSGSNKVSIATEDLHRVRNSPIAGITYLPLINLNPDQLVARFGEPSKRIREPNSAAEHWLYPRLGLDVVLNESGKEVLQYIMPSRFAEVSEPLEQISSQRQAQ